MTISMHLDKARRADGNKRWALWVREWDGIDKPEYTEVVRLEDDLAKLMERCGVAWKTIPDWTRLELEDEKARCLKRAAEIVQELKQSS